MKPLKKKTIFRLFIIPLVVVMVIQALISYGTFLFSGTPALLNDNAVGILKQTVENRKLILQNDMVQNWSDLGTLHKEAQNRLRYILQENHIGVEKFLQSDSLKETYLEEMIEPDLEQMRKNTVTGSFLILTDLSDTDTGKVCSGIYFRNSGPGTNNKENSDILMERGTSRFSHSMNIPLDSFWTTDFQFGEEGEREADEFFYQPYRAALDHSEAEYEDLGFWSRPFILNDEKNDSYDMITYSVPLIYEEKVYGILGVEISTRYLTKILPARELDDGGNGGYMLAEYGADGSLLPLVSTLHETVIMEGEKVQSQETVYDSLRELGMEEKTEASLYADISRLRLYNTNTPYEDRAWVVAGVQSKEKLFGMGSRIVLHLLLAILIGLAFGVCCICLTVSHLTKPIRRLAECISGSPGAHLKDYNDSGIMEIDGLYEVVKDLTRRQQKTENSLTEEKERYRVALQSSMDILFSYDVKDGSADMYNIKEKDGKGEALELHIDSEKLIHLMETRVHEDDSTVLMEMLRNARDDIYIVFEGCDEDSPEDFRWMEISGKVIYDTNGERTKIIGSIRSLQEQKVKELSETDTVRRDAVMGIYKRSTGESLIISELDGGKTGCLVLLDTDKFMELNEKYGIVFGDAILEQIAAILRHIIKQWKMSGRKIIAVRMGGDEILLFIEDCKRKETVELLSFFRSQIEELYQDAGFELQLSGGLTECTAGEEYEVSLHKVQQALTWSKMSGTGEDTVYEELTGKQLQRMTGTKEINDIAGMVYERNIGIVPLVFNFFDKSNDLRGIMPVLLVKLGNWYGLSDILVSGTEREFHTVHMSWQWHRDSESRIESNAHYFSEEEFNSLTEQMENRMLTFEEEKASRQEKEFFLLPRGTGGFIVPLYDNGIYMGSITYASRSADKIRVTDKTRITDVPRITEIPERDMVELQEITRIIESNINKEKYDLASRAKSDFLSRMSHEIRTPMNAIMGMTTIALSKAGDKDEVEECLNKIESSSEYLLSLINDILDMSKIESGKMKLEMSAFSLKELIDGVNNMIAPQAKSKGIEYQTDIDMQQEWVLGDSLHVNQVLINLLSNAFKFTPEGGKILLTVHQELNEENNVSVYFSVKDTGIGISEENRKRIFQSFEQADTNTARAYGGTGLGLAISEKLVYMMGGQIQLQSRLGKGSDFSFRLSFKPGVRSEENRMAAEIPPQNAEQVRILLVEDNPLNMEIAQTILEMNFYEVEPAEDGKEAVSKFTEHISGYYDLILMDIKMPVMDGLEATRTIRSLDREDARTVPIVAMSANAFAEDVRESLESGMNGHLSKPINVKELLETIRRMTGKVAEKPK